MVEILRSAHGNGEAALLRAETPPLDELPAPNADDTARGLAAAKRRGKPFTKGNAAARNRRPALAALGLEASDPRYRRALKKAERYRQRRVRELATAHGGYLSAGVAAMVGSAARALASSLVLHELADEMLKIGSSKANKAGANLLLQAARLADSSRQQEITAIAIADRELRARPTEAGDVPWLLPEPTVHPTTHATTRTTGTIVAAGIVTSPAITTVVDSKSADDVNGAST